VNGYLVDTNVLSELTKLSPDPRVEDFLRQSRDRVSVSVLSIGEIRKGIVPLTPGAQRALLEDWLENEIMPWFGNRVLSVTLAVAEHWGYLAAISKMKGRPRPVVDALLAATAVQHDLVLVTRNIKDYEDLGVTILNPWESVTEHGEVSECSPA
jgi:predicted nucleic acid-binding protein